MTGKIMVMSGNAKVHRRRYIRIEDVTIELTDEWVELAEDFHIRFGDTAWRDTIERIIKLGLSRYKENLTALMGYTMEKELNE